MFLQKYKGHKIYLNTTKTYQIGYQASDKIWKRNIKSLRSCKIIITKAHKQLKRGIK